MHTGFPSVSRATSLSVLTERVYASAYEALENDDLKSAERFFGLLAVLAPTDERAWVGLGVTRERCGDWPMAAARYSIGSALVPQSAWCHLGRARALEQLGRSDEAELAFDEAETCAEDAALLHQIANERRTP